MCAIDTPQTYDVSPSGEIIFLLSESITNATLTEKASSQAPDSTGGGGRGGGGGGEGEGRGATFDEGSFRVPAFICEESEENLGHYFRIARSEARHPSLSLSLSLSLSTMLSDLVPGLEEKFNFTSGRGVEDAAGS